MRPSRRLLALAGILAITTVANTCGGSDSTGPQIPTACLIVSGNNQSAVVGQALPSPLVVKVVDIADMGVPGVPVAWLIERGGGRISASTTTTDGAGIASATWTMGDSAEVVGVRVSASGSATHIEEQSFTATALPGQPTTLAFSVQPSAVVAGAAINPAVQVSFLDARGNTVTNLVGSVVLSITSGTGAAGTVLGGTLTQPATAGVATFANLTLDKVGAGYTLTASDSHFLSAVSSTFTVTPGAAAKLAFTVQPSTVVAGAAISPAVQVLVQDALGNTVASATTSIALAITSGTGTTGAVLGGTLTQAAVAGIGMYANLTVDKVGTGYTLTATASGLTGATSGAFAVSPGAAASIAKQSGDGQTTMTATQLPIAPAVVVKDAYGNAVPGAAVTFAIVSGGGSVTGANQTSNAGGVATVGSWTLGSVAGANTLSATAVGAGISGNPATFSATGTGNVWTTMPAMPTQRTDLAIGAVNGILYAVGGKNSTANWIPTVEAYDPATNTWSTKAQLPTERTGLAVGVVNGILYAVGGANSTSGWLTTVEAYDPATNTWATKAPMPTARTDLAVGVVNGILYAVGGRNSTGFWISTVEAYDPVANSWTSKASLPVERTNLAVGVVNGILYAVGGANSTSAWLDNVDAYDPVANSWTARAPLPTARTGLAVGTANGILYAFGGANSSSPWLDVVEAYNPAGNSWLSKTAMPTPRTGLAAGTINGIMFGLGGANSTGSWLSTAEVYHP
jgi:hypothetical protein